LAEARGIKLTRQGANLLGKCPFHDHKTPSLVITPAKNLWHCMGACNAGRTAIDWVMKAEGISFRHAVELLTKDDLPLAASPIQPVKKSTVPKLPAPLTAEAGDRELLLEVVDFYQTAPTGSPEAMRYLESRGLKSAEMVERFRLGFANRTLGYGLEAKNRAGGAAVRGRCSGSASTAIRAMSTSTGRWLCLSSISPATWWRCTGARSRRTSAPTRTITCIFLGRCEAYGTRRR
jgi:hypothetical protein